MGLITLLRGFKVPIAVLDRFLAAHGVEETEHIPPHFIGLPGWELDPQSTFFRARLAPSNPDPSSLRSVRLFIPSLRGAAPSDYGYVAYAFVMVYAQRHVELAAELPEQAPLGFAALRDEILGFAAEGEQALLQAAGMQSESGFFVVVTEEKRFPLERPFVRESDLRCKECGAELDDWSALYVHRTEVHRVDLEGVLPDDL